MCRNARSRPSRWALFATVAMLLASAQLASAQERRLGVEPPPPEPALNMYARLTLNGTALTPGADRIGFLRWTSTSTAQGFSSFSLEKRHDAASAKLAQYCADGTHFDLVELDLTQSDGSVRTQRLRNATITSYSLARQSRGPANEVITIHGQHD